MHLPLWHPSVHQMPVLSAQMKLRVGERGTPRTQCQGQPPPGAWQGQLSLQMMGIRQPEALAFRLREGVCP